MMIAPLLAALSTTAYAQDITLTYQGRVLDSLGQPVTGTMDVEVALWASATSEDLLQQKHSETFFNTAVEDGYVSVVLGAEGGLDAAELATPTWVELTAGSLTTPRQPLTSVPQAAHATVAGDADTVDGQHASAFAPAAHSHGQANCVWSCVDTPGTLLCPSGRYMAGISFPQIASSSTSPPPQTCSGSTNSDDVAVYCCTVQ